MMTTGMNDNFIKHLNHVEELKKEFMAKYANKTGSLHIGDHSTDCIKKMRYHHGLALIEYQRCVANMIDPTEEEVIAVSTMCSILHVIHSAIRFIEKYHFKNSAVNAIMMTTDTDEYLRNSKTADTRVSNNGINEEISLNIETESPPEQYRSETFLFPIVTSRSNAGSKRTIQTLSDAQDMNATELANDLNTAEADKLFEDFKTRYDMVIDQPTLILYWSDSCGASNRFYPEWEKFKELAKLKYPKLQVTELNVKKNPELQELARKAGVSAFPTVVYFKNGKVNKIVGASQQVKHIEELIKKD